MSKPLAACPLWRALRVGARGGRSRGAPVTTCEESGPRSVEGHVDEDGLRHERDPETIVDPLAHLARERDDFGRGRPAPVHDGQGVAAGEADVPALVALAEAGPLDEAGAAGP